MLHWTLWLSLFILEAADFGAWEAILIRARRQVDQAERVLQGERIPTMPRKGP